MSQSVIGALRVNLGLDSAQFQKGAKRVQDPLRAMRNQFLAVSAAAAAFGAAIFSAARKGADEIDRAAKAARRLDLGIGAFRGLELAASEAGIPISALTNDIQNVNREIANIGISGNAERALERLGLSVADLADLDSTDKIAAIADRVQELGLSAGEATAVLRDLGVRNREMVLLLTAGGDAIRAARSDIEDYGLAVSEVDASRIEAANDAIGRLGLITQYAGQQLAIALVPALGRMAEAMTDSLRAGGTLRAVIDGLANNIERLGAYVTAAVGLFGARYVGALVAARLATLSLSGALLALRGALVRIGIGAIIVGVGELIYQFGRLVRATGGVGETLSLLKAVWKEVVEGFKVQIENLQDAFWAMSAAIQRAFVTAFAWVLEKFSEFTQTIADGINGLFANLDIDLGLSGIGGDLAASMRELAGSIQYEPRTRLMRSDSMVNTSAIDHLRGLMRRTDEDAGAAAESLGEMSDEIEEVETAGGGAGGAMRALSESLTPVQEAVQDFSQSLGQELSSAFSSVVSGSKNASEALRDFANNVLAQLANRIFQNTIGNSITGAITGAFTNWIGGAAAAPAAAMAALPTPKSEGGAGSVFLNVRAEGLAVEASQSGNMVDMVLRQAESRIAGSIARGGEVGKAISQTYQIRPGLARRG